MKAGERVGPYELISPVGAGGMGEVWKARDTRLDRIVALKFCQPNFTERFQGEVRAIAALNHPNIATLYDVGPNYFVMEYVDGEPLRPPGDIAKLLDIVVQTADGLAAAHAAGFIHRDLKPDNILLSKAGRVKILDFGLAKRAPAPGASRDSTLTQPGMVIGTVAYMSPEQVRGQELDLHSDQFSFGLILYELAAGKRPFQRPTAAETMAALIREQADPLPATLPAPQPPHPITTHYRFTPFAASPASERSPAWSPDGRTIAYIETTDGVSRIIVKRVDGGTAPLALARVTGGGSLSWSPDGERIYYAERKEGGASQVLFVSRAGGHPTIVLDSGFFKKDGIFYDTTQLSPDGKTLAMLTSEGRPDGQYTRHLSLFVTTWCSGETGRESAPMLHHTHLDQLVS